MLSFFIPRRSIACAYSAFTFKAILWLQVAGTSQFGQRSVATSCPHLGQVLTDVVCVPHFWHRFRKVISPQPGHRRRPTSISIIPPSCWKSISVARASDSSVWFDASWNDRRAPPDSRKGKSPCGGGLICAAWTYPAGPSSRQSEDPTGTEGETLRCMTRSSGRAPPVPCSRCRVFSGARQGRGRRQPPGRSGIRIIPPLTLWGMSPHLIDHDVSVCCGRVYWSGEGREVCTVCIYSAPPVW